MMKLRPRQAPALDCIEADDTPAPALLISSSSN
jgi:hypothetical protein